MMFFHVQDKKVNWHSTPFEVRLERALTKWWCLKLTQAILLEEEKCEMLELCVCDWVIIYFSLVSPCICD